MHLSTTATRREIFPQVCISRISCTVRHRRRERISWRIPERWTLHYAYIFARCMLLLRSSIYSGTRFDTKDTPLPHKIPLFVLGPKAASFDVTGLLLASKPVPRHDTVKKCKSYETHLLIHTLPLLTMAKATITSS